ncbi:MAG: UvrD-helicase domain-containing protein [Proteobacteria bacterium]|nr:UvrD-helicase domain-containing protein [Pseudomonadota bacterium]
MSEVRAPADQAARERALATDASFIVQAPAGSGKTTLLTQRYLALLATVADPEAVLAVTFTRKAAAEMRERVLDALARSAAGTPPRHPGEAATLALAAAVRAHAATLGWALDEHPARLRILTLDALNQWLAARLPVLSRAGVGLAVEPRPAALYRLAAERTLAALESGDRLAEAISVVLAHADNDVGRVCEQLAGMLQGRERWLRHLIGPERPRGAALRAALEAALAEQIEAVLARAARRLADAAAGAADLVALAAGAVAHRPVVDADDRALECAPRWPWEGSVGMRAAWRGLARALLTEDGKSRRSVNKHNGFPTERAAEKAAFTGHLQALAADEGLREALRAVRQLPPPGYGDAEWRVLEALDEVLIAAATRLQGVFAERGVVDFAAVSRAALQAIGTPEEPTDLTLALDGRIEHLLIDEFQDTSTAQVELLRGLTAGWTEGDGRTLFLVGDPMQSIYGFREANVSLFLEIRAHGLGALRPEPLTLAANFRSRPALVEWFNRSFAAVLPPVEDLARGAVRHAPSAATRPPLAASGVRLEFLAGGEPADEAARVAAIVETERRAHPEARIAVLARTRSQLTPVAAALERRAIPFRGVELVPLAERLAVRDLVALTRAICHPADRIAWLAVLRAPWGGVPLDALDRLIGEDPALTVAEALAEPARLARLDLADAARVRRVQAVLDVAIQDRGRRPLAAVVESAWLALGGPATLADAADLDNARAFLARIDLIERARDLDDPAALETELADLYAAPDPVAPGTLQLLTIHKAKGLEWDVVIVTGLGRGSGRDEGQLLEWLEFVRADRSTGLVLAPDRARSRDAEPLVDWLRALGRERRNLELDRLLYVAATRAQERLYLVGHVEFGAQGPSRARGDTLLGRLSPAVEADLAALAPPAETAAAVATPGRPAPSLSRLTLGWQRPAPRAPVVPLGAAARPAGPSEFEFEWVTVAARHVGTVVHEELERVATGGQGPAAALGREDAWSRRLAELGVGRAQLADAIARVRGALESTSGDARGRWLFDPAHVAAASELELATLEGGRLQRVRIDRTFVDASGLRWIVDYKTSAHEGTDLESFFDQERERYRGQLERYAALVAALEPGREIRLGLYFALYGGWREWVAGAVTPGR